jgi:hypothetical protein
MFMTVDLKEQEVKCIDSDLSPPEQVQQAINCFPNSPEDIFGGIQPSFRWWTILDYAKAYSSGKLTPRMVCAPSLLLG